jgi:hypothetical protein
MSAQWPWKPQLAARRRRARGSTSVIVPATIGNVLEWFDFMVYGFFAVTIAGRCQRVLDHDAGAEQGR